MLAVGADPSHIVQESGLSQIEDEQEIVKIVQSVISKNPKAVEDYKKGKENALQFLGRSGNGCFARQGKS